MTSCSVRIPIGWWILEKKESQRALQWSVRTLWVCPSLNCLVVHKESEKISSNNLLFLFSWPSVMLLKSCHHCIRSGPSYGAYRLQSSHLFLPEVQIDPGHLAVGLFYLVWGEFIRLDKNVWPQSNSLHTPWKRNSAGWSVRPQRAWWSPAQRK